MTRFGMIVAYAVALTACNHDSRSASGGVASVAASSPPPPVAAPAAPAKPFEGEIVVTVKDESATHAPSSITFDVKGDKVRYGGATSNVHTIANVAGQFAYAVNDSRRVFANFDTNSPPTKAPAAPEAKVTKTGRSEKVAGLPCDDWSIDDGTEKVDVCAAKGIAFFDLAKAPRSGDAEPTWAAAMTREKAFPLRIVAHDKAGKEEYRAEATKADARAVADSVFEVPAAFNHGDLTADMRTASLP